MKKAFRIIRQLLKQTILETYFGLIGRKYMLSHHQEVLCVGSIVMVRSNEPEPLVKGVITELFTCHEKWDTPFPIVKFSNGLEKLCTGIVIEYNEEMFQQLNIWCPIEQWNLLAHNRKQITEKYGVTYRSYAQIKQKVNEVSEQIKKIVS